MLLSTFEETMKHQKIIFPQKEMSMPISYTVKFRVGRGTGNTVYLFWPEVKKVTGLKCVYTCILNIHLQKYHHRKLKLH